MTGQKVYYYPQSGFNIHSGNRMLSHLYFDDPNGRLEVSDHVSGHLIVKKTLSNCTLTWKLAITIIKNALNHTTIT